MKTYLVEFNERELELISSTLMRERWRLDDFPQVGWYLQPAKDELQKLENRLDKYRYVEKE